MGASEKKSSEAAFDVPTLNAENLQSNMKIIYYSRTFMSIIGGVIAGILGFTGLTGFICWNQIILDGFLGGLLSFVLFWTFAYDIVHIF
ncbi:unnamed protein product [Malus baccata var. baccata]